MRKGQNPAKLGIPAYIPKRLGVAVLTYIPDLDGYFAESLEVLTTVITSLRYNTGEPFDLLVFDNGSCSEARQLLTSLHENGQIDWLVLSRHNLGKAGALNWIFASLPNDLVCYTDGDVFFRQGWFQASLAILDSIKNAGMVAAQPCFFDVLHGSGQAYASVGSVPTIQVDSYKPPQQVVDEYCRGIDATPEAANRFNNQEFTRLTDPISGTQALLGASHMQFLASREVLRQVLPLKAERGLDQAEDRQLDERIDGMGLLHLATPQAFVFHIGNTIDEHAAAEMAALGMAVRLTTAPQGNVSPLIHLAARLPGGKQRLRRIYNDLYQFFARSA